MCEKISFDHIYVVFREMSFNPIILKNKIMMDFSWTGVGIKFTTFAFLRIKMFFRQRDRSDFLLLKLLEYSLHIFDHLLIENLSSPFELLKKS